MKIDPETPLFELNVEQFLYLQNYYFKHRKYEVGIKGIARIFNCSESTAKRIKKSGIIDAAIIRRGQRILIRKDLALKLFNENEIIDND